MPNTPTKALPKVCASASLSVRMKRPMLSTAPVDPPVSSYMFFREFIDKVECDEGEGSVKAGDAALRGTSSSVYYESTIHV